MSVLAWLVPLVFVAAFIFAGGWLVRRELRQPAYRLVQLNDGQWALEYRGPYGVYQPVGIYAPTVELARERLAAWMRGPSRYFFDSKGREISERGNLIDPKNTYTDPPEPT